MKCPFPTVFTYFGCPKALTESERKDHFVLCEICSAEVSRGSYKCHKQKHNKRTMPCSYCDKMFKSAVGVRVHEATCPNNPNPQSFLCQYCSKSFNSKGKLAFHLKSHRPDAKKHVCHICDAKFMVGVHLQTHLASHSDTRKYVCSVCNADFKTTGHLQRHEILHNEALRYTCPLCPHRKFVQYGNLKIHMKVHEKEGVDVKSIMPPLRARKLKSDTKEQDDLKPAVTFPF